jgi:hypothetical protein
VRRGRHRALHGYNPPVMQTPSMVSRVFASCLLLATLAAHAQGFSSVSSAPTPVAPASESTATTGPVAPPASAMPAEPVPSTPPAFSSVAPEPAPAATTASIGSATIGTTIPFGSGSAAAAEAPPRRAAYELADRVVVRKSERRLYLLHADRIIAEYPIHLGLNPVGHKEREGDFRTPEGSYTLVRRNPRSDFFLSLEVSYPNDADRKRARQHGVRPGGLIMIHGQPNLLRKSAAYYARTDWTDGCIAVSNSDMVDIWLRTELGTPIEIRP